MLLSVYSVYAAFHFTVKGAVYISTEDVFPSKRLHQLIPHFTKKHKPDVARQLNLGDNIFIEHAADLVSVYDMAIPFRGFIFVVATGRSPHQVYLLSELKMTIPQQ